MLTALDCRYRKSIPFFLPCPRMGLVVDPGQVLEVQVGVYLGGADVGVAQQFLHRPQVAG